MHVRFQDEILALEFFKQHLIYHLICDNAYFKSSYATTFLKLPRYDFMIPL